MSLEQEITDLAIAIGSDIKEIKYDIEDLQSSTGAVDQKPFIIAMSIALG